MDIYVLFVKQNQTQDNHFFMYYSIHKAVKTTLEKYWSNVYLKEISEWCSQSYRQIIIIERYPDISFLEETKE